LRATQLHKQNQKGNCVYKRIKKQNTLFKKKHTRKHAKRSIFSTFDEEEEEESQDKKLPSGTPPPPPLLFTFYFLLLLFFSIFLNR
jgi:hypothetical protein